MTHYDVAIIGGGINGCGIARDAAGRGLSVLLLEQNDLASGTSSASTKLIHGGLRYLEHGAFRLVRESLQERDTLMRIAPHLIRPLRFVMPAVGKRPAWLLQLGLLIYDRLGGSLPRSRSVDLTNGADGEPLTDFARGRGFEYYDCWADDARLVVANAKDAARRGAHIVTRAKCEQASADACGWRLKVRVGNDQEDGAASAADQTDYSARCLINAAGPWAGHFLRAASLPDTVKLRLVQGSHLIVPKLFEGECAYVLPNADQRIIFAIPYAHDYTLIGTTDRDFQGAPEEAQVDQQETDYLLSAVHKFFRRPVNEDDIAGKFCGIRPLSESGAVAAQKASRDYLLRLQYVDRSPLLNVFGGKLTTYRQLAQKAIGKLQKAGELKGGGDWTSQHALPGGDLPSGGATTLTQNLHRCAPHMPASQIDRLAQNYGAEVETIFYDSDAASDKAKHDANELQSDAVDNSQTETDDSNKQSNKFNGEFAWGQHFGGGLYAREVDYLMREEWARTAEDILWRRTRLGLTFPAAAVDTLDDYMRTHAVQHHD